MQSLSPSQAVGTASSQSNRILRRSSAQNIMRRSMAFRTRFGGFKGIVSKSWRIGYRKWERKQWSLRVLLGVVGSITLPYNRTREILWLMRTKYIDKKMMIRTGIQRRYYLQPRNHATLWSTTTVNRFWEDDKRHSIVLAENIESQSNRKLCVWGREGPSYTLLYRWCE